MLQFTGDQGRAVIETVYPKLDSPVMVPRPEEFRTLPLTQTFIHHSGSVVIQALDAVALVGLARTCGGVMEMLAAVGDTVVILTPLLCVYGARHPIDETVLINAIETGEERTFEQDPK